MADKDLEQKVSSVVPEIGKTIDLAINDAKELGSKLYYSTKAALPTATSYALGGIDLLISSIITAGGFVAGKLLANWNEKKENTYKDLANEATVGGVLGIGLHYFFQGATIAGAYITEKFGQIAGLVSKGLLGVASIPPFMEANEYANRALIKDYEAKPWDVRKVAMKDTMFKLGAPIALNTAIVPPTFKIPTAAAVTTAYAYLQSGDKQEPKQEQKKAA